MEQEEVVTQEISDRLRRSKQGRIIDLVEEVARRCAKASVKAPSRSAVSRRWKCCQAGRQLNLNKVRRVLGANVAVTGYRSIGVRPARIGSSSMKDSDS